MSEQQDSTSTNDDGFQWAIVEVMGHRRHVGRMREEELCGAKMLRIDVPTLTADVLVDGQPQTFTTQSWVTHFYASGALFSVTMTDEASGLRANQPQRRAEPRRYLAPPCSTDFEDFDDDRPF